MIYYTQFESPFCQIILAGNQHGLSHLHLNTGEGRRRFEISKEWVHDHPFFLNTMVQITEYFEGKRKEFHVTLNPQGTDFQKRVWHRLCEIPYGELRTYKGIAKALGNEKAARAVGMANSKNPIPLIIPCHRVIGTDGGLTGFAHGLALKERLIRLEKGATNSTSDA
jgi:methylated-DNA-[protein]-cysteine S-methyltransferase